MTKARFYLIACLLLGYNLISIAQPCADPNGIILVTNTDDEGDGSLRAALDCANSEVGSNTIRFDIQGTAPYIINVGSTSGLALPALIDPATTIDGRTQSGYNGTPLIVLNGGNTNWGNPINAVWLRANFCEVYALEIRNFPDDGIDLRTADFSIIQDNYIHDNGSTIDYFPNVPGTGPWEGCGIVVREGSDFNTIIGNEIENNEFSGILFRSGGNNNLIGGPAPEDANIISFNAAGIIVNENSSEILIQQNSIFCNDTLGIQLNGNANDFQMPPVIDLVAGSQITGTAEEGDIVDIFISNTANCPGAVCQGGLWIGSANVINGEWFFNPQTQSAIPVFGGYVITATTRDILGNTSEFSSCEVVVGTSACTEQNGDIIVTNNNDSGAGSLRQAILCANATLGANTIRFEIPGDTVHVIYVGADANEALPALLDPATILDATTQAGFGTNGQYSPRIILDGIQAIWTAPINAIWVRADFCEIYGLEIRNFPDDGIDVTLADYVKVGAIDKGNVVYNNGDEIDFWPDAPGTGPWNGCGIVMKQGSDFCEIIGNYVGTDYRQVSTAGNELCGIVIQNGGDNHLISNNIIANHRIGVRINNGGTRNTLSQNNLYCNDSIPLSFLGNANLSHEAPTIDSASNLYLSGLADSLDIVEVFINVDSACAGVPCQGSVYLGTAVGMDSTWVLEPPFANGVELHLGDLITATATDPQGNTSVFSTCVLADIICDLEVSVNEIVHTSCGNNNGAFTVNILNGTAPYSLDIGMGITEDTLFNNLASGTYTLTVTDVNNCTATAIVTIDASTSIVANPTNIVDASCGENNGSFSVDASLGTAPYTYDIGNGPQASNSFSNLAADSYTVLVIDNEGCTQSTDALINQTGAPQLSIDGLTNPTCLLSNGAVILDATDGLAPYLFDIGNGSQSNPEFTGLASGNYTATVTDDAECTATITFELSNDGLPPIASFTYTDEDGTLTFENTSSVGEDYFWNFGDGNSSTLENPIHTYATSGDYQVCLSATTVCGTDTYCEVVTILVPLTQIDIGGEIAKPNGQTVALVDVTCTNNPSQTTAIDGQYLFEDQEVGTDYTIVPFKDINYINGCSTYDIFLINQHLLEVVPLDSPYKIIAADVDNNGHVSTLDMLRLQQLILFIVDTFPNNTSWRFIPEDYVFTDPADPLADNFPESITLTNASADDLDNDFIAMKIGDVNWNANPASFTEPEEKTFFNVRNISKKTGELILEFTSENLQELSAFELSLLLDPRRLEFLEVIPQADKTPIAFFNKQSGLLNISWFDEKGVGLKGEAFTFQIRLNTLTKEWQSAISLSEKIYPRSFDLSGKDKEISLQFENETATVAQVFPNPFLERTKITFELDHSADLEIRVLDINGQEVFNKKDFFEKGKNEIEIDLSHAPAGIYYYELGLERGVLMKL